MDFLKMRGGPRSLYSYAVWAKIYFAIFAGVSSCGIVDGVFRSALVRCLAGKARCKKAATGICSTEILSNYVRVQSIRYFSLVQDEEV
jgi:hypothetical protein